MVCICFFSPSSFTDTELFAIAEREGVFECFGDGERERINKISNPSGKALSLGGLIALGRATSELGISGRPLHIFRDSFGKPRFEGEVGAFSISHASALAVAAVSVSGEIGIDIERIDPTRDTERIAERFFSDAERSEVSAAEDKVREFYRIWTAKEAMMKLGGEGMISIMSSDSSAAKRSGERSFARRDISFDGADYILTLCTRSPEEIRVISCDGVVLLR